MRGPITKETARASVLARLQLGLETLYRVDTQLDVEAFLIDEESRREAGVARSPREQLLIREDDESMEIALFVDQAAIANLEENDPGRELNDANFADFCLAVEGVSHFVYLALAAASERSVSALELELQAEVDKFVCCLMLAETPETWLVRRLFDEVSFAEDLDADEHDRYRTANSHARRYAAMLSRRFAAQHRWPDMLNELRRFYRLGLRAKLGHIASLG